MVVRLRKTLFALVLSVVSVAAACLISTTTRGRPVPLTGPIVVSSPVKAHLRDGSVVVFRDGVSVMGGTVVGVGWRYNATLSDSQRATPLAVDSVLGLETFERTVNAGRTLVYAPATGLASTLLIAILAAAIFGSCPTIYADSAGVPVLQAESFSYSIAPLLEKRDVDRLSVVADSTGIVRLEVRNEALETHYIDHLELVEVLHDVDELVLPAGRGGPLAVRALVMPTSVTDRAGRDVRRVVSAVDDAAFASDDALLARAAAGGPTEDYIDVTLPRPHGRDSVALVLRMRSSLLSTALFYDQMLARPGARSLDWVGRDLKHITSVAQLANWYVRHFGLRVSVLEDGRYRQVARLVDFGPAAWRNVAAVIPIRDSDSVRIRLSFLADEWRIDRLAVASELRRPQQRLVPLARVTDGNGLSRLDAHDVLLRADDRRLQTSPGQRFFAHFDVGRTPPPSRRTFLLAAQGYYVEWVRGSWVKASTDSVAFRPSDEALRRVLRGWRASKDSLERHFFSRRVPII
jgi:hypothetical protein